MQLSGRVAELDQDVMLWQEIRREAEAAAAVEPALAGLMNATILNHDTIAGALSCHLAQKLGDTHVGTLAIRDVCAEALAADPEIEHRFVRDLRAVRSRDPACRSYLQPFLFFKGTAALEAYRIAHFLWLQERELMAFNIQ